MAKSEETIKSEIDAHIQQCGGAYSNWYVGIAADARDRLFSDHTVDEKKDAWIYRNAENSTVARRIEKYFIETLGTDGGPGGGSDQTTYVYAYKKNAHTEP
ncbi:hypothetical protein Heshes_24220 [Alicyclobacillus hesperidum]|uniref:Uncharacterized protein n=1 Tax=Alicyclobacillus hesperidum TaxID=89784 RepID=A0AA37X543_9BACL|nr:hypothetical protein Heshes_24220 [Alicyclobacillus hesperidum]